MTKGEKKKRKIRRLLFLILIVLIIAVVAINVSKHKDGNDNENQNLEQQNVAKNNPKETLEEKYVQTLDDGNKVNTSEKLKENKKIDSLELKDIQLMYKNGVTTLLANVENSSNKTVEQKVVEVTLLNDNNEKIYTLQGIIEEIEAGGTKQLNCSITADFVNAYDFTIKEK